MEVLLWLLGLGYLWWSVWKIRSQRERLEEMTWTLRALEGRLVKRQTEFHCVRCGWHNQTVVSSKVERDIRDLSEQDLEKIVEEWSSSAPASR
jgi:hypothetical protein